MAYELKAQELAESKLVAKELIIGWKRDWEIRIPIAEVNDWYIENQSGNAPYILFDNLMVSFEGEDPSAVGYAQKRTKWVEEDQVWVITSLYNSHGLYNYAEL